MAMSAAEDDFALSLVKRLDCPVILVLNKIDAVRKEELLPLIAHWSALHTFADVVPISARKKEGLELLLEKIVAVLPEGQRYFPARPGDGPAGAVSGGRADSREDPDADRRRGSLRDGGGDREV